MNPLERRIETPNPARVAAQHTYGGSEQEVGVGFEHLESAISGVSLVV
jgi:hypothetical protein